MLISHRAAEPIDGLSRSSRERLSKAEVYPQPVRITARRIGFVKSEVEAWAASRIAARDSGLPSHRDPVIVATNGTGRRELPEQVVSSQEPATCSAPAPEGSREGRGRDRNG